MMRPLIRSYIVYNRDYVITRYQGKYCSIPKTCISSDGRLLKRMTGLDMCASDTLPECLELTRSQAYMDYLLKDCGYTRAQALARVTGITLEQAQAALAL